MKIRLTSNNLYANQDFMLYKTNEPLNWNQSGVLTDGSINENIWSIKNSCEIYNNINLSFLDSVSNIFEYLSILKGATVRANVGGGSFSNNQADFTTLTSNFVKTETIDNTTNLTKIFSATSTDDEIQIKDFNLQLMLETNVLRIPEYTDDPNIQPIIIKQKNSKKLESFQSYTPVTTTLSFLNCIEETKVLKAFFRTCALYKRGFTVEVWQEDLDTSLWGGIWADSTWGSSGTIVGGYSPKYYFDLAGYDYNDNRPTATLDVPVILQKREVGYFKDN